MLLDDDLPPSCGGFIPYKTTAFQFVLSNVNTKDVQPVGLHVSNNMFYNVTFSFYYLFMHYY